MRFFFIFIFFILLSSPQLSSPLLFSALNHPPSSSSSSSASSSSSSSIVDPSRCVASGPGLSGGPAGWQEIDVLVLDVSGRPVSDPSAVVFDLSLASYPSPLNLSASPLPSTPGLFRLDFLVALAGQWALSLSVGSPPPLSPGPVPGSPWLVSVEPAALDPGNALASGQGLSTGLLDLQNLVTLQLRDAFGNHILAPAAANVSASLSNQPTLLVSSLYMALGRYSLSYTPYLLGPALLSIYVDAVPVLGSPFDLVVVQSSLAPRNTQLSGPGLANATAGVPTYLVVSLRDEYLNSIDTVADIQVVVSQRFCKSCSPVQSLQLPTVAVPLGMGFYRYTFEPQLVVDTFIHVSVNHVIIPISSSIHASSSIHSPSTSSSVSAFSSSPSNAFTSADQIQVFPGMVSATHSNAYGNGISHAVLHRKNTFYVQLRDALSNPVLESTAQVVADIYRHNVSYSAVVAPLHEGLYRVSYHPTEKGEFFIYVALQDDYGALQLIKDAPFTVKPSGALSPFSSLGLAVLGCFLLFSTFCAFVTAMVMIFRKFNRDNQRIAQEYETSNILRYGSISTSNQSINQ